MKSPGDYSLLSRDFCHPATVINKFHMRIANYIRCRLIDVTISINRHNNKHRRHD